MQIAQTLPGARYYGSFIAQSPSLSLRERSQDQLSSMIDAIVPGEVLGAHLHYSVETQNALSRRNALHLFIWRDPRDVIVSEAHYLAEMNRWHAMHQSFAALKDPQDRIKLAINGDGTDRYRCAKDRINAYMHWRDAPGCLSFSYEELTNQNRLLAALERIMDRFETLGGKIDDRDELQQQMIKAIDPGKSHTFNKGGTGRWRKEMSDENVALLKEMMPEIFDD